MTPRAVQQKPCSLLSCLYGLPGSPQKACSVTDGQIHVFTWNAQEGRFCGFLRASVMLQIFVIVPVLFLTFVHHNCIIGDGRDEP